MEHQESKGKGVAPHEVEEEEDEEESSDEEVRANLSLIPKER